MKLDKILVPTDFSDAAGKAYEQAKALARGGGVAIRLVHRLASPIPVFASPPQPGASGTFGMGEMLDEFTAEVRTQAESRLRALVDDAPEGVAVDFVLEERYEPHEAILASASSWGCDLLVMGTHGRHGLDRILMGSVTSRVLHRAERNVMLVRPDSRLFGEGSEPLTILVPVDFSEHAQRALGMARLLAKRPGSKAKLHLMHVVELQQTPLTPGGLSSRFEDEPELREKYREALLEMLGETPGDVTVAEGTIAGEILWWREKLGCDLIVMGSRGHSALARVLLGSATEQVARFSEVPVLVVR